MISSQQTQEEISDLEKRRDAIDQEIIAFRTLLVLRLVLRLNSEQPEKLYETKGKKRI